MKYTGKIPPPPSNNLITNKQNNLFSQVHGYRLELPFPVQLLRMENLSTMLQFFNFHHPLSSDIEAFSFLDRTTILSAISFWNVWPMLYFFAVATLKPFSANIHLFQSYSSQVPLNQSRHMISTFYSELNEFCEKNIIFFILGPKKGFFGGIKRFNLKYSWPIILPNFLGGAIYRPLRT